MTQYIHEKIIYKVSYKFCRYKNYKLTDRKSNELNMRKKNVILPNPNKSTPKRLTS